jgi:hypothetical protein
LLATKFREEANRGGAVDLFTIHASSPASSQNFVASRICIANKTQSTKYLGPSCRLECFAFYHLSANLGSRYCARTILCSIKTLLLAQSWNDAA